MIGCSFVGDRRSCNDPTFMKMLPSTVLTNTKPVSGDVCEDVWNLTETIGLLTLLLGLNNHEREQLEACIGESTPETLPITAANLGVVKHMWLRLSSAIFFSLRAWSLSQFYISQKGYRRPNTLGGHQQSNNGVSLELQGGLYSVLAIV